MYLPQMAVLEASFFSALDLLGYFHGCGLCFYAKLVQKCCRNGVYDAENGVYDADNIDGVLRGTFAASHMELHVWRATKNIKRERQNRIFEN